MVNTVSTGFGAGGCKVSWQIVPLEKGLGVWREEWDALNSRLYGGHPFCDSRFVDPLLQYFGAGSERLCIHRTENNVDGMLILYQRRFGVWTQFVPAQAQSAPVLIEKTEYLRELFPVLARSAWMIEILCQDPDFMPESLLDNSAVSRVKAQALTMNVNLQGAFEDYWGGRSKKLVQNMRRYRRRAMESFGSPEMRVITVPESMGDAVARYGDLEAAGWKGPAGTAVNITNTQGLFYVDLMKRFAETGDAEVVEYWFQDKLAASRLVIRGGGMSIMLKTAYDEGMAEFAPGRLLLEGVLERAFSEKRSKVVEFYTDATQDQLSWATGQRHIYHSMFFRDQHLVNIYDSFQYLKRILG